MRRGAPIGGRRGTAGERPMITQHHRDRLRRPAWLALSAVIATLGVAAPNAALAAETYTVNTTALSTEPTPDGTCDSDPAPGVVTCSFLEALVEANADGDADTIAFAIPGAGVKTVAESFDFLPAIVNPLTIDGYTQPGAKPNTAASGSNAVLRIVLDGPCDNLDCSATSIEGLRIQAGGVTIRGLVIQDFNTGIQVSASSAVIAGNRIGTDAAGGARRPNRGHGIEIDGVDARVGGTARADRNVISGNDGVGVLLLAAAKRTLVQGNLIGTNAAGTRALGNKLDGVRAVSNVWFGEGPVIGGSDRRAANVIAFNGGDGVNLRGDVQASNHIRILGNRFIANDGLAIDLLPIDGRDPNDYQDGDQWANGGQNHPDQLRARSSATRTTIKGRLMSIPIRTYRLQFFASPGGDEAARFIGERTIKNTITGFVTFTFVPKVRVKPGWRITATATDVGYQQTSELSRPVTVRKR